MAKKILLAEDSVTMQRVIQMTFAAEDVTVTSVDNVGTALERAKEMDPDVIIADLSMAGQNGYDLCAALRREGDQTPVLLLHGPSVGFDADRAQMVQADADIAKPFDTQALIDRVGELTREVARAPVGPIQSLASPIDSGDQDIVIDAGVPPEPMIAASPLASPPPSVPRSGRTPPLTFRPQEQPEAPPAAAPSFPAAQPVVAQPPAPSPSAAPTSAAAQEITIEAEPPRVAEQLPSFAIHRAAAPSIQPGGGDRMDRTIVGTGAAGPGQLPQPPPGMPLPRAVTGEDAQPAVIMSQERRFAPPADAGSAVPPVQQGGDGTMRSEVDPAVYEAIVKLSRDVIERIVWEVVPDLAESLISERLDQLVTKRVK